jgi:hypothetical protein
MVTFLVVCFRCGLDVPDGGGRDRTIVSDKNTRLVEGFSGGMTLVSFTSWYPATLRFPILP